MLVLGLVLILAAVAVLSVASGLVMLPSATLRHRARALAAPEVREKGWQRLRADVSTDGILARLTAPTLIRRIERNLVLAGRPDGWPLRRVIVAKPVAALLGVLFAWVLLSSSTSLLVVLVALGAVVLAYFVPDLLIYNSAVKRQEAIQKALPDMLDQIVISIEAGVGFEQALTKVADSNEGPLKDEIVRLLQDVSLGMSRRDAYAALADRTSVDELKGFAKALVQAEQYGISISSVVRTQATEMRLSRRMRAEARAQQVPVKILLPLMSCILPVLFIIVLGPAVVSAYARN
ncbi:type II secretion system F family protein [Aeromicrobium chenweiae]|uniref:Secretion system protein n=1 Tax=Aeromicrobium chenweiae TaxID=2079793 RepID=A0A2S0WJ78_9ACTN|nr:type II secretion system F family protein [Aeromicrobium chenweiae]AWB91383.1 secretion system protein [Aeromicrobium chenweiae]TGN30686.1 type II secretion system F family protein [Aeromicrobium chenweiae]